MDRRILLAEARKSGVADAWKSIASNAGASAEGHTRQNEQQTLQGSRLYPATHSSRSVRCNRRRMRVASFSRGLGRELSHGAICVLSHRYEDVIDRKSVVHTVSPSPTS